MDEWGGAVTKKARAGPKPPPEKWIPPKEEWLKVNVDGAVSAASGNGGGGTVVRDHTSAFRGALTQLFPNQTRPEIVELLACRMAMEFGRELGIQRIHVELDCKEAVSMLNSIPRNLSMAEPIVKDITELMQDWTGCKITWRRRTANLAAHTLAKIAAGDGVSQVWRLSPPDCILSVLADEIPDYV